MIAGTSNSGTGGRVRTRRVHYFSGFDPRGAAYYHRLYRDEAKKQALLNHSRVHVGKRQRRNDFVSVWQISSEWHGESTTTDYQFMHWDDLVRDNWQRNSVLLWSRGLLPYLKLFTCGYWLRIRSVSKSAAMSGAFPIILLLLVSLIAILAAGTTVFFALSLNFPLWISIILVFIINILIFKIGFSISEKLGGHWVLRTILFVSDWACGHQWEFECRLSEFVKHIIIEQRCNPVDEVLLVGHSIGTMVAVDVAAQLSAKYYEEINAMKLLTLGHCIPMLSFMPGAEIFRVVLKSLASTKSIPWMDVTIPPDPLCFYSVNPVELTWPHLHDHCGPKLAVARVFRMFEKQTYSKLRWNKLRLHFQYLMASELPVDYDFFLITAGPKFLHESLERCEIHG
jgi:hypothetical protein